MTIREAFYFTFSRFEMAHTRGLFCALGFALPVAKSFSKQRNGRA
jgi:hypothetical protein